MEEYNSFGLAPLRREGMPIHPHELYWECECPKCKEKYNNQLIRYFEYMKERGYDITKEMGYNEYINLGRK